MKSITVLKALAVTLILGTSTPALAHHCIVKKGDTIWGIADRYNINFKELKRHNNHFKDHDLIYPDDKVHFPCGSEGHATTNNSSSDDIQQGNEQIKESSSNEALEILRLVNAERKKQGLNELVLSNTLNGIATEKAKDMRDKNYFSHTSPTYGTPFQMLQQFGVTYSSAGENIAAGQTTAQQVMTDWLNSTGHRANILSKNYTELGVGYVKGGKNGTYWVQLFIKP